MGGDSGSERQWQGGDSEQQTVSLSESLGQPGGAGFILTGAFHLILNDISLNPNQNYIIFG